MQAGKDRRKLSISFAVVRIAPVAVSAVLSAGWLSSVDDDLELHRRHSDRS
jgi:hypothetical protein